MYLLVIFLPLASAISTGFFGKFLGKKGSISISNTLMLITSFLVVLVFYNVCLLDNLYLYTLGYWINNGLLTIEWGFLFDKLTAVMCVVVVFVSTLVHIYSCSYMKDDPHLPRFMSFLSFFTFFMLILISANNFFQLFLGWEGVGLCSYLLISFWYTRIQANKSAIKAMIMNRIGDLGLFLGIILIYWVFSSLNFKVIFETLPLVQDMTLNCMGFEFKVIPAAAFFLFIGSVGKSAQIGLHTWLPDAMEGPTPVSALIHAATMVTAGVFLIIRCSVIFEYSSTTLMIVTTIGALTSFFAATVGVLQNDIKKVIAYSTCSQLGYMVFICGLSNYSLSLFHVFNHAFFKALLFLGAGSVIHSLSNEQDMRKMGGLSKLLPFTFTAMVIGSLALMGFPFLAGFFSKDVILEVAYASYSISGKFSYLLGTISAFFTAFYSIRLLFLVFIAENNSYKFYIKNAHELDFITAIPLTLLSVGSILSGYLFKDMFIGMGSNFFNDTIYIKPQHITLIDAEFIPFYIKIIPTLGSFLGAILALIFYQSFINFLIKLKLTRIGYLTYKFLNQKWYIDLIYNVFVGKPFLRIAYNWTFKLIDKGLIEILGPKGLTYTLYGLSRALKTYQTGLIYHYACILLITLIFFLYL